MYSVIVAKPARAYTCIPTNYFTVPQGWIEKWFPGFSYAIQQDRVVRIYSAIPSISTSVLQTESQSAYAQWNNASGYCLPSFSYSPVASYPAPNKTCVVIFATHQDYVTAGGDPFIGIAKTLLHADYYSGNLYDAELLIDGSVSQGWSPSCAAGGCPANQFSLLGVVVHEWGHMLALDHPAAPDGFCTDFTVMDARGSTPGSSSQETLKLNDAYAISRLYQGFPVSADLEFSASGSATTDTLYWSETISRYCWYNLSVSDACWGPYTSIGRVMGVTATNHYSFIAPAQYYRNYYYRLTVEQSGVVVDSARTASIRTQGTPVTVPGTPASLSATPRAAGGAALSWQASSGPVDGYYVYRSVHSLPDCGDADLTLALVTGTSMVDSTAQAGLTYAYRVRAFNSTASSAISEQVTVDVPPPDNTPPAAVNDLTLSGRCTSLDVQWTAPGDDGTSGTAHHYDLRMSTSNITNANFSSATPISTGAPGSPGTQESVNVYLGACSGRQYFALKTVDEVGNTSALSNVTYGGTPCIEFCDDGFAPVPVARLAFALAAPAPNPARGSAELRFSIPARLAKSDLELSAFDPLGRPVRTIQSAQEVRAGTYSVTWDLRDARGKAVPNGVYFLRLQVGAETMRRTLLVVR
jgi:hypothetical protein